MKNWKTTLFGSLAASFTALSAHAGKFQPYCMLLAAGFGIAFAFSSKDNDVTGGTRSQQ